MPLIPRSLLWRTFFLLAALVLLTTAAWFLIFRAYENEPRARGLAQNLVSVVNDTMQPAHVLVWVRPDTYPGGWEDRTYSGPTRAAWKQVRIA